MLASVRSGWLSVTVTPVSTSPAAAAMRAGREVVQGPPPPVVVPAAPIGDGVEELPELRLRHLHAGHGATLGRRDARRIISSG